MKCVLLFTVLYLFYDMLCGLHGAFRGSMFLVPSTGYPWVVKILHENVDENEIFPCLNKCSN